MLRKILFAGMILGATVANAQEIDHVEDIQILCQQGCVPRLPEKVWTTYRDGKKEWRQVRWMNYLKVIEKEQTQKAAGEKYQIQGFVVGDETTIDGFPIRAQVTVTEHETVTPGRKVASPLPLQDVRLTGDNTLTHNRERDVQRLLEMDISQQLYNYYDTYGLETSGMKVSDGWDAPTIKLKGHGVGHYLSALALAECNETRSDVKSQLLERITKIVNTMRLCQERTIVMDPVLGRLREARDLAPDSILPTMGGEWKDFDVYKKGWQNYGYGYINAIPPQHLILVEAFRPYNNEKWVWAPYYTVHKQLAGLCDVVELTDNEEIANTAMTVARDMGLWVWNRLHYRTTAEQRRRMWNMYIAGEVGGMQEVLARIAQIVQRHGGTEGDVARLTEAATFFDAPALYDPLSRNIDEVRNRHANQHIPMITGALRLYGLTGKDYYRRVAENFWQTVQNRYTYAMGGVGNGEMFREPYAQMASLLPNPDINETCCAYNLMKLTRDLNQYHPNDARMMDYCERLLTNQITGSLAPDRWAVTYQYAVGMNAVKPYGNNTPQESCCGGTGVENHVRYQECAYYTAEDTLWVGLYLPTSAEWRSKGMHIEQSCHWPATGSRIRLWGDKGRRTVRLRVPYWADERFDVRLNGKSIAKSYMPCSYVEIPARKWSKKDIIEVVMPFSRHLHYGTDKIDGKWPVAVMDGPMVLTTSEVRSWKQAEMTVQQMDGLSFVPDYMVSDSCTHYLLLHSDADHSNEKSAESELLMTMARERALTPEAWAPHGFQRMLKAMKSDENIAELNTILSTMRPANLAEPEDVESLKKKVVAFRKRLTALTPSELSAVEYAEMVIRYVTDGSGTRDMIDKAEAGLQ